MMRLFILPTLVVGVTSLAANSYLDNIGPGPMSFTRTSEPEVMQTEESRPPSYLNNSPGHPFSPAGFQQGQSIVGPEPLTFTRTTDVTRDAPPHDDHGHLESIGAIPRAFAKNYEPPARERYPDPAQSDGVSTALKNGFGSSSLIRNMHEQKSARPTGTAPSFQAQNSARPTGAAPSFREHATINPQHTVGPQNDVTTRRTPMQHSSTGDLAGDIRGLVDKVAELERENERLRVENDYVKQVALDMTNKFTELSRVVEEIDSERLEVLRSTDSWGKSIDKAANIFPDERDEGYKWLMQNARN